VEQKIFIGLDPGSSSGAWAIIDQGGNYMDCGEIPTVNSRVNAQALSLLLHTVGVSQIFIAVEDVHTMPKQGLSSSGKFMRAAGAIEAVAALTGDEVVLVRPQVWKKHHGLIGTDKKASLEMARQIWPDAPLHLVKHHGRADALLMAMWLKDQVK